jgi:hypothetical protein
MSTNSGRAEMETHLNVFAGDLAQDAKVVGHLGLVVAPDVRVWRVDEFCVLQFDSYK